MPAGSRAYMLEIFPKHADGRSHNALEVIDARWIDTETGVFINIITVRPKEGEKDVLQTKDKHVYRVSLNNDTNLSSLILEYHLGQRSLSFTR